MKRVIPLACALLLVLFAALIIITKKAYDQQNTIKRLNTAIVNIETVREEDVTVSKYNFIDIQKAVYIEQLSVELHIDPNLSFAILMVENPEFNPDAINKNINGTVDIGLFQLNDRYVWTTFRDSYWIEGVELDPFNWKHNCYLAIHHIKYLQDKLKVEDDVIMAYNCGIGSVINNSVPSSTYAYLAKVKNNMWLLKKGE